MKARRFHFERDTDESGVSGTGRVADGVELQNGWAVLWWNVTRLGGFTGLGIYPSMETIRAVHGHDGKTRVVYDDPEEEASEHVCAYPCHGPEAHGETT